MFNYQSSIWFSLVELDLCLGLLMVIIYGLTNLRYQHLILTDVHFACICWPLLAVLALLCEAYNNTISLNVESFQYLEFISQHIYDILLALITVVVLKSFKNFESLLLMIIAYIAQAFILHSCDLVSFYVLYVQSVAPLCLLVVGKGTKATRATHVTEAAILLAAGKLEAYLKALNLPYSPYIIMTYDEAMALYNSIKAGVPHSLQDKAVVYGWLNNLTGHIYIGSATIFQLRTFFHVLQINLDKPATDPHHVNIYLKAAILLCGLHIFSLVVFEVVDDSTTVTKPVLLGQEQVYLDCVPKELQYNINPSASSNLGSKWSQEQKDALNREGPNNPNWGNKYDLDRLERIREIPVETGQATSVFLISSFGAVVLCRTLADAGLHIGVSYVTIRNYMKSQKPLRRRDSPRHRNNPIHGNVMYFVVAA